SDVTWVSGYETDPFTVSPREKTELLAGWSAGLLAHPAVSHADASVYQVKECKFYTDGSTTTTQQRVRLHPALTATAVTETGFDDMRTLAPPAAPTGLGSTGGKWAGTPPLSWPSCPSCSPPSSRRRPSRPAATTW